MKYLYNREQFLKLFEGVELPKFVTDFDINANIIPIDNYLRKIQSVESVESEKLQLNKDKRGAELNNKDIIAKSDADIDSILKNKAVDSVRLEKAWRLISNDLDSALKNKKVEFNGQILAENIINDNGQVKFDFTFNDADSLVPKQKNNGQIPFKTQILAGEIINKDKKPSIKTTETYQIRLETGGSNKLKVEPVPNESFEITEAKWLRLRQQGWRHEEGTYNWLLNPTSQWVNLNKESLDTVFKLFPKTYFKGDEKIDIEACKMFKQYIQDKYITKAK
jgi:hypothetical protein